MGTVDIFIDGGYLQKVLKIRFNKPKIDLAKLSNEIAKIIAPDTIILRTYFYDALPYKSKLPTEEEKRNYDKKQRYLYSLNQLPRYTVRYGKCIRRTSSSGKYQYSQKQVDVLLSVDLAKLSAKGKIQYAAILSGDSDFVPAINLAKEEGVMIYLFHEEDFPKNELWLLVDERVPIKKALINRIKAT